ncbi:MAG: site-specific integrase [Oscillospiraceae bacterium]|nr:site-specific integrase [Oscillospiraceae bacterium]
MTGSLQVKNNKYYAVLNTYDANGKRKPTWISTGFTVKGNKKRAETFLQQRIRQYTDFNDRLKCDVLLSDYVRHWLSIAKLRKDAVTYQGYEAAANAHILPYFDQASVRLVDANHKVLQVFFDEKAKTGRIDGKGGLSAKTLRIFKNILRQTFTEAMENELISSNPCDKLTLPPIERYEYSFYNAQEITALFDALKHEPLLPLIKVTVLYGLRRSELLGLQWDSVDFVRNTLTIRHTVSLGTKVVEKNKTKTESSYRSFPLMGEVRAIFLAAKQNEESNKKLFGKDYHNNSYIFKWPDGTPYAPAYITHKFDKLLKANDLRHIRFHELRHSCASYMIDHGFTLKDIQEWLGHADIKLTANIYSHLDVSRKQHIAASFSDILGTAPERC